MSATHPIVPEGREGQGCLSKMKVAGEVTDVEMMEHLNHCLTHKTSFLCAMWMKEEHALGVWQSGAGFYIGVWDPSGAGSRDSEEYWATKEEAQDHLDNREWTQRLHP